MAADEKVIVCDVADPKQEFAKSRADFYKEQADIFKKTGKPTQAVTIVNVFIFDQKGEIFVQKRANTKNHNPRLLDKSIGGHIKFGDTPDYTVMVETVQELQVPSIVSRSDSDFEKTYDLLHEYLDSVAVIKKLDSKLFNLNKIIAGESIVIANNVHLYIGVYNGSIRTVDREAKGVLLYSLEDLESEIADDPKIFTDDIKLYLKEYKKELGDFAKFISKR